MEVSALGTPAPSVDARTSTLLLDRLLQLLSYRLQSTPAPLPQLPHPRHPPPRPLHRQQLVFPSQPIPTFVPSHTTPRMDTDLPPQLVVSLFHALPATTIGAITSQEIASSSTLHLNLSTAHHTPDPDPTAQDRDAGMLVTASTRAAWTPMLKAASTTSVETTMPLLARSARTSGMIVTLLTLVCRSAATAVEASMLVGGKGG